MKIVFISNYITPHQIPLCTQFYQRYGSNFAFVETMKIDGTLPIGWRAKQQEYPFVLDTEYVAKYRAEVDNRIMDADVVIIGSAPDEFIIPRLKAGKLTFKYAERFYKTGLNVKNFAHSAIGTWLHHGRLQKYSLFMLCASAYTPCDCAFFGNYKNRMYCWGYFPETRVYHIEELIAKKQSKTCPVLLWAGRLISWKHPEAAIVAAGMLKKAGYQFLLRIIGTGEMELVLTAMIAEYGVEDCVSLLGQKTPEDVRSYMEDADIFLFTSDYNEGWGAVLNESMNSGCAVVASHAIGAVPYLVKHNENGLVYRSGDVDGLYENLKYLLDNPGEQERLGYTAYETITGLWNAEVAAQRLVKLSEHLLAGEKSPDLYEDGPCSTAKVIPEKEMYRAIMGENGGSRKCRT